MVSELSSIYSRVIRRRKKRRRQHKVVQIAVKRYHWKGDYSSGISSQINP